MATENDKKELRCPTCGSLRVMQEEQYVSVFRCLECKELFSADKNEEEW